MSGDTASVRLIGPATDRLVAALDALAQHDFALVGGLAVMTNLATVHRPTIDIDGVFDNSSQTPTTVKLVTAGTAEPSTAPQRVTVRGTDVDVIDTFALPESMTELPDNHGDRLFVCAHRYAYETARPAHVVADNTSVTIRVSTAPALIAMKAHALRFASTLRRSTKRNSDLSDLYLLAATHPDAATDLRDAPWELAQQSHDALVETLEPLDQTAAALAAPDVADQDDVYEVLDSLLRDLET